MPSQQHNNAEIIKLFNFLLQSKIQLFPFVIKNKYNMQIFCCTAEKEMRHGIFFRKKSHRYLILSFMQHGRELGRLRLIVNKDKLYHVRDELGSWRITNQSTSDNVIDINDVIISSGMHVENFIYNLRKTMFTEIFNHKS